MNPCIEPGSACRPRLGGSGAFRDDPDMDLNAVKMLIRVAEAVSFTLAAASLQMTQPGLSRAISRLEAELGCACCTGPRAASA